MSSFILCLCSTYAARILAILKIEARSHFYFHEALLKSLARAGHEVTLINQYVTNADVKNFSLIQMPAQKTADDQNPFNAVALKATNSISMYLQVFDLGEKECESIMMMPFIQVRYTFSILIVLHYFLLERNCESRFILGCE